MTGSSRRTGKAEGIRELAAILNVAPPSSVGGTIPKDWLLSVLSALGTDSQQLDSTASKSEVLKTLLETLNGVWDDGYVTYSGSTITGEAVWYIVHLLADCKINLKGGTQMSSGDVKTKNFDCKLIRQSIWRTLGGPSDKPPTDTEVLRRAHEDSRFLGTPAPADMAELLCAVLRVCDADIDETGLDDFIAQGSPTHFAYAAIQAHLEIAAEHQSDLDSEEIDPSDEADEFTDDFHSVDADVTTQSVAFLYQLVKEDMLDLTPPWQRTEVWTPKKKKELVYSLLIGIPLPSIILNKKGNSSYSVIDGKQRLSALVSFMDNEFKLPKYKISESNPLYQCRDCYFKHPDPTKKSLPREISLAIETRKIPALEFRNVPEKLLRRIFQIYNVSGVKLSQAEVRNAAYQENPIYRSLVQLAGPIVDRQDLNTGDFQRQLDFSEMLEKILPSLNRFLGVQFLCRYLGYSRAPAIPGKSFKPGSTSSMIDRYLDHVSMDEDPATVAKEIVDVFRTARTLFNINENQRAFYMRDHNGNRKFNQLISITNLILARFALALCKSDLVTMDEVKRVAKIVANIQLPDGQQTPTIWDFQASRLLSMRDHLEVDVGYLHSQEWTDFFDKMEFCRLTQHEDA